MRNLLKQPNTQLVLNQDTIYQIALLFIMAIIAYNTSSLPGIRRALEEADQNKDIVVNVNTSDHIQPLSSTTAHTVSKEQANIATTKPTPVSTPAKTEAVITPPASDKKAPTQVEENANPTTHQVEMLNNSPDGAMVFKPGYLHIKTGDSVEFLPASYGHNVQTPEEVIASGDAIPKAAKPFKSAMNEKLIVKFTEPGVYLYICNYHYIVGHVGVIQVGNDSHNLNDVKKAGEVLKGKIFSHPERVDKYLNMVQVF